MLGENPAKASLFQMVDLEDLVPRKHRLRRIDAVLDLSFVRGAVAPLYSKARGRPSLDPELAVRMLLLGTLYDLSDRELCQEIGMHAGFRWFCRLDLHDPVPNHSTLSKLKERWAEAGVFDQIFDRVVRQCVDAGLVSGRHVSVDGTQVQANASMKSLQPIEPEAAPSPPRERQEPQPNGGWDALGVKYSNRTHRSQSDPDARLYRKGDGRESKLSYLMHDVLDTKSRVILRRRVTEAHAGAERVAAIQMLDEVTQNRATLGLKVEIEIASFDAGYGTGEFAAALLERDILPHMPLQAAAALEEVPVWQRRTFNLARQRKRSQKERLIRARNRVRELQRSRGYQVSRRLRIRSEHAFAEAKTRHGMRRARSRGLWRLAVQATLAGIVQNLKRLASGRGNPRRDAAQGALRGDFSHPDRCRNPLSSPGYVSRHSSSARLIAVRCHRYHR
jgi:transposase